MTNRLNIYIIDTNYVHYLEQFDRNVCDPKTLDGGSRPYVGIFLFETTDFYYFAPLTSQTNKPDFYCVKLYGPNKKAIASVRINNMIPIPKRMVNLFSVYEYQSLINSTNPKKRKYGYLLKYEVISMNHNDVKSKLEQKAKVFYRDYKVDKSLGKICNDFKLLEEKALEFKKTS